MKIKNVFKLVVFIVAISLMLIIILSNASTVRVNLIFFSFDCPSIVLILANLFIGYIVGTLTSTFTFRSDKGKKKDKEIYVKETLTSEKESSKKNKK